MRHHTDAVVLLTVLKIDMSRIMHNFVMYVWVLRYELCMYVKDKTETTRQGENKHRIQQTKESEESKVYKILYAR